LDVYWKGLPLGKALLPDGKVMRSWELLVAVPEFIKDEIAPLRDCR
jgi:hypothetical protein